MPAAGPWHSGRTSALWQQPLLTTKPPPDGHPCPHAGQTDNAMAHHRCCLSPSATLSSFTIARLAPTDARQCHRSFVQQTAAAHSGADPAPQGFVQSTRGVPSSIGLQHSRACSMLQQQQRLMASGTAQITGLPAPTCAQHLSWLLSSLYSSTKHLGAADVKPESNSYVFHGCFW